MTRRDLVELIVVVAIIFAVIAFLAVSISGCHDGCESDATRCNGDRVEICNTDDNWEKSVDCKKDIEDFGLGIEWTCCVDPEDGMPACLPVGECMDAGV